MKHFFLIKFLFLSVTVNAQTSSINGTVRHGSGEFLENANVMLLKAEDSIEINNTITGQKGNFQFSSPKPGDYLVKVSSVGYRPWYSHRLQVKDADQISLGEISLQVKEQLKEVVVNTRKAFVERKNDKLILNVDAMISNTGTTALEMLESAPGVTVDKDGNISLQGRQGVIIMIDGKPTYMTGMELTNFLRNLPSTNLEQVEIMTNPSAKYDASGNAGIINLKTKKIRQKGFNGSLSSSYGQGFYPKTHNSLNLNYRVDKINLFGTLSANYRGFFQELDINRIYKNADGSPRVIFDQQSDGIKRRNNYNVKFGMDYFSTKKTTFGIVLTGYTTPGNENGEIISLLKNGTGNIDSIVTAQRKEKYTWRHGAVNLNFRHAFDSAGREITADVDYLYYAANRDQLFTNTVYNPGWEKQFSDQLKGELPATIKIVSARIDYVQNLFTKIKFETGVKSSFVATDNTAAYYNIINGDKQIDYEKTNQFVYNENINAAYINFSRTFKKWSVQSGLRIENTNYDGNQFGNPMRSDSAFKRSYTSAFPTAYLSYNPSKKHQFGFSYGRRINRPDYEDLNPFLFFLDKYTYGSGNPFLRPMFSNVFELSHTFRQKTNTTINYSNTTDLFNDVFEERGLKTIQSEGNYGKFNSLSLSVSTQLNIVGWWKPMLYAQGRYQDYEAILYGNPLSVSGFNFLGQLNNQFQFKKGWSAELTGMYRTKIIEGQVLILPMGMVHAGVQKNILKDKGSLKLAVRDMFRTMNPDGEVVFHSTEARFRQRGDTRVLTFSFNYRFGKPIKGLPKRKTGSAAEEQNRIKSGN